MVVDHVVPHRGDQRLMWDPGNFQTLCATCHNRKTASEGGIVYGKVDGRRYVVTGPPGSGKTTWVQQRAKPGDIVFDLDVIAGAVSRMPRFPRPDAVVQACLAMRDGLLEWLASTPTANAFVIVASPSEAQQIAAQITGVVTHMGHTRTGGGDM